jgi:small-conductance mechanosensitive channel
MLSRFINSDNPTQILLVIAAFVITWLAAWNRRSDEAEIRAFHVEKINVLLLLSVTYTVGAYLYLLVTATWPTVIAGIAFVCWVSTALAILAICRRGWPVLSVLAAILIVMPIALMPKYHFSVGGMLNTIDRAAMCWSTSRSPICSLPSDPIARKDANSLASSNGSEPNAAQGKPSNLLKGAYVTLLLFLVIYYYGQVYRIRHLSRLPSQTLDAGAVNYLVVVFSVSIAATIGLWFAGVDLPSLSLTSAIFIGAISFPLNDLLKNLFAGISLILRKSIKKGDLLTINEKTEATVERITPWHTIARDFNGISTLIPNSALASSTIKNWSHAKRESGDGNVRVNVPIGVAFDSDLPSVQARFVQAARRVKRVVRTPSPQVQVSDPGESAINLLIGVWINDPEKGIGNLRSQVYYEVLNECNREDPEKIVIPFPRRDIHVISTGIGAEATLETSALSASPNVHALAPPLSRIN